MKTKHRILLGTVAIVLVTLPASAATTAFTSIYAFGAKTILLGNLPNLGDTPELLATGNPGAINGFRTLSQMINAGLAGAFTRVTSGSRKPGNAGMSRQSCFSCSNRARTVSRFQKNQAPVWPAAAITRSWGLKQSGGSLA